VAKYKEVEVKGHNRTYIRYKPVNKFSKKKEKEVLYQWIKKHKRKVKIKNE